MRCAFVREVTGPIETRTKPAPRAGRTVAWLRRVSYRGVTRPGHMSRFRAGLQAAAVPALVCRPPVTSRSPSVTSLRSGPLYTANTRCQYPARTPPVYLQSRGLIHCRGNIATRSRSKICRYKIYVHSGTHAQSVGWHFSKHDRAPTRAVLAFELHNIHYGQWTGTGPVSVPWPCENNTNCTLPTRCLRYQHSLHSASLLTLPSSLAAVNAAGRNNRV